MRLALALAVVACGSEPRTPTKHEINVLAAHRVASDQLPVIHHAIDLARSRAATPIANDLINDTRGPEEYARGGRACSLASAATETLATVADPLLFELARLCQHELPLAVMRVTVADVEADRLDHDEKLESCSIAQLVFDDAVFMTRDLPARDPEATELAVRLERRCGPPHWFMADERQAFGRARAEHRPVLIVFTAKWSVPSLRLERTLDDMLTELEQRFVPLRIDASDESDQVTDMQHRYGAETLPHVVVVSPDGKVLARITQAVDAAAVRAALEHVDK